MWLATRCHPELTPFGAPVEGRPSEVEAGDLVTNDPEHEAVLSWTETIEWSGTATELILHS